MRLVAHQLEILEHELIDGPARWIDLHFGQRVVIP